ncbi:MAG TPA: pyridoxamine 5'-phosphate oxidase family protein [Candidatus Aquabacterium excrementipullorum]|nr:pyridoxamine 5'-phosphate oxidase family protein [Candidatus Aquabacterium excrementipullorum]
MSPAGEIATASPFHEGEQRLQDITGVREVAEQRGRLMIRDHMPDQHRTFFEQLPFVLAGGLDATGQPWATVWAGPPGFMRSPDPHRLHIGVRTLPGDPLAASWHEGSPIGLLGIEPHTRRRNRMNGTVRHLADGVVEVGVRQSFGNCPKYIRPRKAVWRGHAAGQAQVTQQSARLSAEALRLIAGSDTFFIASASAGAGQPGQARGDGVDVSHRGGEPGFVHVTTTADATELTVPDYAGNWMFNTLGNILVQPRVGLVFIDVARGDVLWLAGQAWVDLDPQAAAAFEGAQRLLRVRIEQGCLSHGVLPLTWEMPPVAQA